MLKLHHLKRERIANYLSQKRIHRHEIDMIFWIMCKIDGHQ